MQMRIIRPALAAAICGIGMAQVTPAHPDRFTQRPLGGHSTGGVEVIPKSGSAKIVRYTTHIVLSTQRFWTSPDGKIVEGKLIAFEDMVAEAPEGAEPPAMSTPPASPTVVRDGNIRLLVKNKPLVSALTRFSDGDREFVDQVRKAYTKPAAPKS
jgi:hypothetical protein